MAHDLLRQLGPIKEAGIKQPDGGGVSPAQPSISLGEFGVMPVLKAGGKASGKDLKSTSFGSLMTRLNKAVSGGMDAPIDVIDGIGQLVAGEKEGWEKAVDTMIDLLGADNFGPKGQAGFQFFYHLITHLNPAPGVTDYIRGSLTGLEDTETHPFRGTDAKKILGMMNPGVGLEIAELDASMAGMDVWRRHNAIEGVTKKTLDMIAGGDRTQAAGVITHATPLLLKIISEDFGSMVTFYNDRFDKAAAMTFFSEVGRRMPEEVVGEVLNQATEEKGGAGDLHPELGQAGVFVLARVLGKNPRTLRALSGKTVFQGLPNYVALEGLLNVGEEAIKPILDQSMKTESTMELGMLGITLVNIGVKAIEPTIDYFDRDDDKMTMRCLALLSPFAYLTAGKEKAGGPAGESAAIIDAFRKSTKLSRILLNATSSGDPALAMQAVMFESLMRGQD